MNTAAATTATSARPARHAKTNVQKRVRECLRKEAHSGSEDEEDGTEEMEDRDDHDDEDEDEEAGSPLPSSDDESTGTGGESFEDSEKVVYPADGCQICAADKWTARMGRPITCPYCNKTCCASCVQAHVLNQSTLDPRCIFDTKFTPCNGSWALLVQEKLPGFFRGAYSQHRSMVLLDRELSLLPTSEPAAAARKRASQLQATLQQHREKCNELKAELDFYKDKIAMHAVLKQTATQRDLTQEEVDGFNQTWEEKRVVEASRLASRLELYAQRRRAIRTGRSSDSDGDSDSDSNEEETLDEEKDGEQKQKPRVVCQCPLPDCRGFVSAPSWKCGICDEQVCSECRDPLGKQKPKVPVVSSAAAAAGPDPSQHQCNPDTLASVKQVWSDSKPCPGCSAPISRIYGCDHMWCSSCKTSFNYVTLKIIRDSDNSNPHLHQWRREQQERAVAVAAQVPAAANGNEDCLVVDLSDSVAAGRMIAFNFRSEFLPILFRTYEKVKPGQLVAPLSAAKQAAWASSDGKASFQSHEWLSSQIERLQHALRHLFDVEYPRVTRDRQMADPNESETFHELRVDFLLHPEQSRDQFRHKLNRRDRECRRAKALRDAISTWLTIGLEKWARFKQLVMRDGCRLHGVLNRQFEVYLQIRGAPGHSPAPDMWENLCNAPEGDRIVHAALKLVQEAEMLRVWCVDALRRISIQWSCNVPVVDENNMITTHRFSVAASKNKAKKPPATSRKKKKAKHNHARFSSLSASSASASASSAHP